jgi:hypothetical protein
MNIGSAINRFEARSSVLQWQAWLFLTMVVILMAFGGYVVFSASSLTARDIGGQDFDKRLESTQSEIKKLADERQTVADALATEKVACGKAYEELFRRWPVDQTLKPEGGHQISFPLNGLPSGDEIARKISLELQMPEIASLNVVGLQFSFGDCHPTNFSLVFPKTRFGEVTGAFVGRDVSLDREKINSLLKRGDAIAGRLAFLSQVQNTIYDAKVHAAASGNASGPTTQSADNSDLLLRLIQTSITRFGVLAVIGFLVSILVSLYRYNIRLSAFYMARADILRLSGGQTTVTDFAVLAAALTPQLEFGKAPQPPLAQLSDLIKSVKEVK